jgi:hypothetical protein
MRERRLSMSDLSKRTYKYYLMNGLKNYGLILLIEMLLILEWILIGSDEDLRDYIPRMFVMVGGLFTPILNGIYSMYGPGWYDSLTLSMGARRKDIFVGQLIKQLIIVACNTAVVAVVASIFLSKFFMYYAYATALIGLVTGAAGNVIGHKLRRYGKVVIMIIVIACVILGASIGMAVALDGSPVLLANVGNIPPAVFPILIILLFVGLEAWGYKLSKTMMVR